MTIHVLSLPNELLIRIVSEIQPLWVEPQHFHRKDTRIRALRQLVLVCRRFHDIATPQLYQKHLIIYHAKHPAQREDHPGDRAYAGLLLQTLRSNPSLGKHARWVEVSAVGAGGNLITEFVNRCLPSILEIFPFLTGVTYLDLWSVADMEDRLCQLAIESMPHLRSIQFSGGDFTVLREALSALPPDGALRSISMCYDSEMDWPVKEGDLVRRSWPVTKLKIYNFKHCPEALQAIIGWCGRLESFTLFGIGGEEDDYPFRENEEWTLAKLHPMLALHKNSLKSIDIRRSVACEETLNGFDLTGFPALEELRITPSEAGFDTTLVSNLAAPRLRVLHWDLTGRLSEESVLDFGAPQEAWLRAVLQALVVEARVPLRQLRVWYLPVLGLSDRYEWEEGFVLPWDRLDAIARNYEAYGVELVYRVPVSYSGEKVTRETFDTWMRKRKLYNEGKITREELFTVPEDEDDAKQAIYQQMEEEGEEQSEDATLERRESI